MDCLATLDPRDSREYRDRTAPPVPPVETGLMGRRDGEEVWAEQVVPDGLALRV